MSEVPDHFFRQVAIVPYRERDQTLEVLLVTSLRKRHWILPKGVVEPDLGPERSALQEAEEEAGVRGVIEGTALGTYEYAKWGGTCRVTVYAMRVTEVLDDWPESGDRRRRWMNVEEAEETVAQAGMAEAIATLRSRGG